MKIGVLPSTQYANGTAAGGNEAMFMQPVGYLLVDKLREAGHEAEIFIGALDANGDGARALVMWGARYAISIHSDAGGGPGHWEALTCYQEERSRPWWETVMEYYCDAMRFDLSVLGEDYHIEGYHNRGYMKRTPGVDGVAVIRIPESVGIPTTLVETNWHDRNPDANAETLEEWQEHCASALAYAICTHLGGNPPRPPAKKRRAKTMNPPIREMDKEGAYRVWSIPDVFNSLPYFSAVFPWCVLHNPGPKQVDVYIFVTRDDKTISLVNGEDAQTFGATVKATLRPGSRTAIELSQYIGIGGYVGGASLVVKCKENISACGTVIEIGK